jgi:hypothetical protein
MNPGTVASNRPRPLPHTAFISFLLLDNYLSVGKWREKRKILSVFILFNHIHTTRCFGLSRWLLYEICGSNGGDCPFWWYRLWRNVATVSPVRPPLRWKRYVPLAQRHINWYTKVSESHDHLSFYCYVIGTLLWKREAVGIRFLWRHLWADSSEWMLRRKHSDAEI